MSAAVCPYCRVAIEPDEAQVVVCTGCATPHHGDCFEENGGCTIFGCSAAPAAEPKLSIGAPDLQHAVLAAAVPSVPAFPGPPPPPFAGLPGAPPPPLPMRASAPPEAGSGFNSWGYNLLTHPLPEEPPEAPPLFSSLGYGPPRTVRSPVPHPAFITPEWAIDPALPRKNRTAFLLLGVLFGAFGAHSFYAGSIKKGFLQLAITVLTLGFAGMMVWIWAVIDICTITTDKDGIPFRN